MMNYLEIILSVALLLAHLIGVRVLSHFLEVLGKKKKAAPNRAKYVAKVFNLALTVITLTSLWIIWGFDYQGVLVFASSVVAVLGVAFFAQWSILSNITASIVIFFNYPTRIGDRVMIQDGENSVEGVIEDITLFQVILRGDKGSLINYPNNLIIQKPVIKLASANIADDPDFNKATVQSVAHPEPDTVIAPSKYL